MGVSKFPKLGLPQLWGHITLCVDLRFIWALKKSYNPCQKIFNGMLQINYTQGNQVDSWLLVVGSQIANLTLSFSFGHNLYSKCLNGSCEPILDICVLIAFQWYKELFNPLGFDPCNRSLKIRESTETPNSQSESSLGSVRFIPSHFPSLPGFLLARNLASPCFDHKPKLGLW